MSASEVAICNSALTRLGAARISSLDDNSTEGQLCREQYSKVRDMLLRSHPWRFSMERTELARLDSTPAYGFDFQYQLPGDCLRVVEMEFQQSYDWTVEGTKLLTNKESCNIKYIKKIEDPGVFDPFFSEVLAAALAHNLSFSLVQSVQLRQVLADEYQRLLREARSYSAQEQFGNRVYADNWLNSRY